MPKEKIGFSETKTGFFRHKKLGKDYLVTNDAGGHEFVTPAVFSQLVAGKLKAGSPDYKRLSEKGFVRDYMDFAALSACWRKKNEFLFKGPMLHILVLTRRCNHSCVYCQTSAISAGSGLDMTKATAGKVLDSVFAAPARAFTIEFQGGEPLLNWPVLEYVVKEAEARARASERTVSFSVVTNLSLMSEERLRFLVKHNVAVCTSLDGPADIHNASRPCAGLDGHKAVEKWWRRVKKLTAKTKNGPDALLTVTRPALERHKDVIDEYVRLGARGIFLRYLNPFGVARAAWSRIGYTAAEYVDYYRRSLDYILKLNQKGVSPIVEHTATILLRKILTDKDPNYMDLRSPCGAGIGQLAYNYDGNVFSCDEARMLAAGGDNSFLLGDLKTDSYADIASSPVLKALVTASVTDTQTLCSACVYKPYCGVCPVFNYAEHNDLYLHHPNFRCEIYTGVLDYLFEKLRDNRARKIFETWAGSDAGIAGGNARPLVQ